MRKSLRIAGAAVAAAAIAIIPAVSASAVSGITQSNLINTPQGWDYQYGSAVSPDGNIQVILPEGVDEAYFAYADSETVVQVTDTNGDIQEPYGAAFTPDGSQVYVTSYGYDTIIIDVATASVVDTIPGVNPCSENVAIGISPDGKYLVQGDECTDIYVYDITNSYAQVGSDVDIIDDPTDVFFPNATTAYVTQEDGTIAVFDLTTGTLTNEWDNDNSSSGACANADASVIAIVPDSSDSTPANFEFYNPATGELLGTADLESSANYAEGMDCAFTGNGKVLVTDWSASNPAVMYVVNSSTYEYEETVDVDLNGDYGDGLYTNTIDIMNGCKAFLPGFFGNVAVMTLPSDYCTAAALPDTGASPSVIGTSVAVSAGLLVAGALALIVVRRRQHG
jgi:YVTN family beta-propeller protein